MQWHWEDKFDDYACKIAALKNADSFEPRRVGEDEDIETFEQDLALILENEINDILMNNLYEKKEGILYELYRFEADQMLRFVGKKENKKWIGLVMHTAKRQIVAFHGGGFAKEDAQALFDPPF